MTPSEATESQLCNAGGPGLAPDPRIGCQLPDGHEGRHEWEGRLDGGPRQKMAWGSSGPSPDGCNALPLLMEEGDEIPDFACLRDPGHDGGHNWVGKTVKGQDVSVDWLGGQMIVLVGTEAHMLDEAEAADGPATAGEGAAPASTSAKPSTPARSPAKRALAKKTPAKKAPAKKAPAKKATAPLKRAPARKAAKR